MCIQLKLSLSWTLAHHPMQQGLAIFNQTDQSEPAPTSATIHWMPITTQLWMNFELS